MLIDEVFSQVYRIIKDNSNSYFLGVRFFVSVINLKDTISVVSSRTLVSLLNNLKGNMHNCGYSMPKSKASNGGS